MNLTRHNVSPLRPEIEYYAAPGPMTDLRDCPATVLDGLPTDPKDVGAVVRGLVTSPGILERGYGRGVPTERKAEMNVRPAAEMIDTMLRLDASPLVVSRPVEHRFIGCCRHFATLSVALLRHSGIPARVRAGFAGYFGPSTYADHWILEYWAPAAGRWVRTDPEIGEDFLRRRGIETTSEEVARRGFRSGGEAWQRCRSGDVDPERFESGGGRGIGEVRGSVMLDLAALNKVEVLPWDTWGRMEQSYRNQTDEAYDRFVNRIAGVTVDGGLAEIRDIYEDPELRVPAELSGDT